MAGGKIKVFHFHNGHGGGVLSVIRNLLLYKQHAGIENHVIYTINKEQITDFRIPTLEFVASEQTFYYSPKWNFYYTCRQLAKLLPDQKSIIVAHDWLELGMCSNLGLPNPVVYFLHGDYEYYYHLAIRHAGVVDTFIAVADNIKFNLNKLLPEKKDHIFYVRFPVPDAVKVVAGAPSAVFNAVFIGRLTRDKGYHLLPEIARKIAEAGRQVCWHIIGEGAGDKTNYWDDTITVHHYGLLPNDAVRDILPRMHALLLPSIAEGMPVTIIEAMKAGVVPIVNDLPGGIRELVKNDETGYKISGNSVAGYADRLMVLLSSPHILKTMSKKCIEKAEQLFNPQQNTQLIEQAFLAAQLKVTKKIPKKVYGSRLDNPWIPSFVTQAIRSLYA